jgi:hypothetical protein
VFAIAVLWIWISCPGCAMPYRQVCCLGERYVATREEALDQILATAIKPGLRLSAEQIADDLTERA